jgi:glycosyltransferase involved in cell wall biosynthesis
LKTVVSNWGVSKEKIRVIYNAFDSVFFNETKTDIRKELSLQGTAILSSGRFVPWKGFEALLQMMPRLLIKVPDAVLYIAGDGPEKERLFNLSYELRQKGSVVFLGTLPKDKLNKYIKATDVFLLNTFYEGFSHQLLEVMSLGTPLITTRVGGNPELVEDEADGLLVQYNDKEALLRATLRVLNEEGLAGRLSESARKKVWKFSKERAVAAISENLYN